MKRGDHALVDAEGEDCTAEFLEALRVEGYTPTTVRGLDVQQGERVPAWRVEERRARFGHVFWERFTERRARKLWGTVHKNAKGDWDGILGAGSRVTIYANPSVRERVDPDHPSGW